MGAGRIGVLLVLTALFWMHGFQSMAVDNAHADMASVPVLTLPASAAPTSPPIVSDDHLRSVSTTLGPTAADQESPAPGAAHALAACLAVLATGLTFLGALRHLRKSGASVSRDAAPDRRRSWAARVQRLRPPDLAVLCLLRI